MMILSAFLIICTATIKMLLSPGLYDRTKDVNYDNFTYVLASLTADVPHPVFIMTLKGSHLPLMNHVPIRSFAKPVIDTNAL